MRACTCMYGRIRSGGEGRVGKGRDVINIQVIFVSTGLYPVASTMSATFPMLSLSATSFYSRVWARREGGSKVIQSILSLLSLVLMFLAINQFYSLIL